MRYLSMWCAHLMCPGMCFGIAVTIPRPFDAVRTTWGVLTVNAVMTVCVAERGTGIENSAGKGS